MYPNICIMENIKFVMYITSYNTSNLTLQNYVLNAFKCKEFRMY